MSSASICSSASARRRTPPPARLNPFGNAPGGYHGGYAPRRGPPSSCGSESMISATTASEPPGAPRGRRGVSAGLPLKSPPQSAGKGSDGQRPPSGPQSPPASDKQSFEKPSPPVSVKKSSPREGARATHYMSGGPEEEKDGTRKRRTADDPLPVDGLGQPACLSTMEPSVLSHVRDTRKLGYSHEEKEELYKGAAGVSSHCHSQFDPYHRTRGKKILPNSPTTKSSIHEVAFNRTDKARPTFEDSYTSLFKEKGGLTSQEVHRRQDATSKRCIHADHSELIHDLVFSGGIDDAHHVHPRVKEMFENAAGVGKSREFGSKKSTRGATESLAADVIYNQYSARGHGELIQGMEEHKRDNNKAGVLSRDLFRRSEADAYNVSKQRNELKADKCMGDNNGWTDVSRARVVNGTSAGVRSMSAGVRTTY